jgi:hypothetical protein
MTRRGVVRLGTAGVLVAVIAITGFFVASAARRQSPEDVAREYGRGVYANDADVLCTLISSADHRAKDQATFRRQQRDLRGFTRHAVRQLAGYITATPVKVVQTQDRAKVTLPQLGRRRPRPIRGGDGSDGRSARCFGDASGGGAGPR